MNLPGDVSEICKSALFEMSLRRCMRRPRDASEIHPCRLGIYFYFNDQLLLKIKNIFIKNESVNPYNTMASSCWLLSQGTCS